MQDDISDGVKFIVEKGLADKNRICIFGASYGGYATLAGLAFTPKLYRCGVNLVGVSNLFTQLNSPYWYSAKKKMASMVGDVEKDREMLKRVSPLFHADKINAPLLIAHGAKDPLVEKSESDKIVLSLRKRGLAPIYMVKYDEGHGFYKEKNVMEFYSVMEEFLAKNLLVQ